MKRVLLALGLVMALCAPVMAESYCRTYSDVSGGGKEVGPVQGSSSLGYSVSVETVLGAGTVGTYQTKISNSNTAYVNKGSAISSAGITESTATAQYIKVVMTIAPGASTTVKVCLYVADTSL